LRGAFAQRDFRREHRGGEHAKCGAGGHRQRERQAIDGKAQDDQPEHPRRARIAPHPGGHREQAAEGERDISEQRHDRDRRRPRLDAAARLEEDEERRDKQRR
jgi:hypothetical protein